MPRDFSRTDRVADQIQKELSLMIIQEINDPRVGMITLSGVEVSKDLAHAKIFVSVMAEKSADETIKALNKAAGFLRSLLAKKIKMRIIPTLHFIYDDTTLKANRISRLIDEACSENSPAKKNPSDKPSE
ncbi:MAG: 30S ribosome-binding factor RbfA [Candidatus Berkiellales bacterium]